ncbi:hypothetical protein [Bacillus velezensis]|uniref:hypothetical protein n=1 Tax=Bacillus velezensis TaxID=492670 RepID=UPI001643C90D|nr:hypothetical protein [Bacillus velezensis]
MKTGEIELGDVWFGYEEERVMLKEVWLRVGKGEWIGFVGGRGGGKRRVRRVMEGF